MNTKRKIDDLWSQFRTAINSAYKASTGNDDRSALRDYAEDQTWHDATRALLGRETANERQHRANRPSVQGFSNESASKLILMNQAVQGANSPEMPSATMFLVCRQTAVEAQVIGHIARGWLTQRWRDEVGSLDYSKLMRVGQ